jgi:aerobic-type carbon monoxide dehydrogenase small subunit (CoxS/CutS family)
MSTHSAATGVNSAASAFRHLPVLWTSVSQPREAFAMAKRIKLNVDGRDHTITADPDMPLLYALRNELSKKGPKFGCGLAQCGACTVIQDGVAIRSCITPVSDATGKIRTLDGLGTEDKPHPLQKAFIEEEAGQCEYCMSGWIMTAAAFLEKKPKRSEAEIREALVGLKCRCGTHMAILRAIRRAAKVMAG